MASRARWALLCLVARLGGPWGTRLGGPERGDRAPYSQVVELRLRPNRDAYYLALRCGERQPIFRARGATEDGMQGLRALLAPRESALDLTLANAMGLANALGLRVSESEQLRWKDFRFGVAEEKADIEFSLERHKGNIQGEGYRRQLQHARGCAYEYLSPDLNPDGLGWSADTAVPPAWVEGGCASTRCQACLLLMLVLARRGT